MENLLDFLINVGKLKGKKRKGWTILHQIKNSESTAEHTFRSAIMAWVLAREKNLDISKIIKMALVHDLCEVYAEDETPYDPLLPKDKNRKKIEEIIKTRSRLQYSLVERRQRLERKFKSELKGLNKLVAKLPSNLKKEIINLWLDYERGITREARFAKQIDKMENLLQALEYWREHGQIQRDLWIIAAREWCTEPALIEFLKTLDKKFLSRKK